MLFIRLPKGSNIPYYVEQTAFLLPGREDFELIVVSRALQ